MRRALTTIITVLLLSVLIIQNSMAEQDPSGLSYVPDHALSSSNAIAGAPGFYIHGPVVSGAPSSDTSAGFGWYSSMWPLVTNQIAGFQLGLSSTWILPKNDQQDPKIAEQLCSTSSNTYLRNIAQNPSSGNYGYALFQSIEGSLGWWGGEKYPSAYPKYQPNVTQNCYSSQLATPGWDFFDGTPTPKNSTGLIQLTNQFLLPPDGITFEHKSGSPQLGTTWLSLPLPSFDHAYNNVAGSNSWTLFLKTSNFSGPVEFVAPQFWADASTANPVQSGLTLDKRNGFTGELAQEWNTIPYYQYKSADGTTYSKIPQLQLFPDSNGNLVFSRDFTSYSGKAVADGFSASLQNNLTLPSCIDSAQENRISIGGQSSDVFQGGEPVPALTKTLATTQIEGGDAYGLTLSNQSTLNLLPQYFVSQNGNRVPIPGSSAPTQLTSASFQPMNTTSFIYTAPSWWSASPAASNTYSAQLNDGSSVDYKWYKFVDQPALQRFNLNTNERERLQNAAEKIQRDWSNSQLVDPPSNGSLASFDGGLLVTPPKGLEIGYVPIVIKQYFGSPTSPILSRSPSLMNLSGCGHLARPMPVTVQPAGIGDVNWPFKCPAVVDTGDSTQPQIQGFTFDGTRQRFTRLANGSSNPAKSPGNIVGCYANLDLIEGSGANGWQIGSINRNSSGYYWTNAAGVSWGLKLNGNVLDTDASNPYFASGHQFILEFGSTNSTSQAFNSKNAPVAKKNIASSQKVINITCVKNDSILHLSGTKPKCPVGFKPRN